MKFTRHIVLVLSTSVLFLFPGCEKTAEESSSVAPVQEIPAPETKPAGLDQFGWMLGRWMQKEGEDQVSYESWKRLPEGAYLGHSCTLVKGDTVWQEVVDLYKEGDEIYMRVDQPQNPGPVAFRLAKSTENSANFVNPEHDFPQQIFYERDSDSTLHARIGGEREGKFAAKDFYMVLAK